MFDMVLSFIGSLFYSMLYWKSMSVNDAEEKLDDIEEILRN
jgi:hypothetical protein